MSAYEPSSHGEQRIPASSHSEAALGQRERAKTGHFRLKIFVPIFYILFLLIPIYWLISLSFKPNQEIVSGLTLWPQNFTLDNYRVIFNDKDTQIGDRFHRRWFSDNWNHTRHMASQ